MEKRIALEKRGLADDKIQELILDNCRSTNIEGLTDSFTALEILSLINVGLVSLKNFPKLPALRKLELSDNRISNALCHLTGSPKLTHLNLSGNRIKDFEELKPLKELQNLEVLDLFNNEVTMTQNYREKIFELIPSLKYLDGFDKEDLEAPSDEEDNFSSEEESLTDSKTSSDSKTTLDFDDDEDEVAGDGHISLQDVYNDNLEDDFTDWSEEEGEGEEDIDEPTDEDEDDGEGKVEGADEGEKSGSDSEVEAEAEESEARGKKRKHDGNDG